MSNVATIADCSSALGHQQTTDLDMLLSGSTHEEDAMIAARAERYGISWLWAAAIMLGLLAGLAVAAAPASALPLPAITINGASPGANSPKVKVRLDSQGGDGEGGALYILTVDFPSSNDTGDEITAVSGQFNSAEASNVSGIISVDEDVGNADPGALFSVFAQGSPCFPVGGDRRSSFSCPNYFGGFGPGAEQSYVIDTTQNQNDPTPLSSLNFTVEMCGQTGSDAIVADNCAPPGPTKITMTKIDQHQRTASFRYEAKRAQYYMCELIHNQMLKFRARCGSTKKYANALDPGQYALIVWGVNAGGGSAKAAVKKFNVG